jgi:hypothetical protein
MTDDARWFAGVAWASQAHQACRRAQLLDIGRKSRFTSPTNRVAHSGPHPEKQAANLPHIAAAIYHKHHMLCFVTQ